MSEQQDPLLRALAAVERDDQRRYPAAWEDVLAGKLAAAEVPADPEAPEEHAALAAMFTGPIDEAEVERLVARASEALAKGRGAAARDGGAAGAAGGGGTVEGREGSAERGVGGASVGARGVGEASAERGASVVRGGGSGARGGNVVALRRRVTVAVVAVLAAAAALVLFMQLPDPGPRGTPMAYALTVRNQAVATVRSGDDAGEVARYTTGSTIDWVLSPEQTQKEEVTVEVVARGEDGHEVRLTPAFTRSPEGALRLRGIFKEVLGLAPGRWQLRFMVGRSGAMVEVKERLEISLTAG